MFSFITWMQLSIAHATPTTGMAIATSAEKIEDRSVQYIPDYVRLAYPMGDVPKNTGVCTDVVIRTYRGVGIDLQQLVHEDIIAHPDRYPNIKNADPNIDHRRVPNLGSSSNTTEHLSKSLRTPRITCQVTLYGGNWDRQLV